MGKRTFSRDVCVIGGCGHVGLPLALTFADHGFHTVIYDINRCVAVNAMEVMIALHDDLKLVPFAGREGFDLAG